MGRIVVGVDGSASSRAALRFALEEAQLRGATLVAVSAWRLPLSEVPGPFLLELPPTPMPALDELQADLGSRVEATLDAALRDTAGAEPAVRIERVVVEDAAAHALIDAARGADMLVVGSRGHGGFPGLLLGSVSGQCVHHAPCPVVVVRAPHDPGRR